MNVCKIFALHVSILLCLAFCSSHINAARILGFFPTPSKSHTLIHAAIADSLARAGHDVTVIGISKNVYPNVKYKFIEIKLTEATESHQNVLQNMVKKPKSFYFNFFNFVQSFANTANRTLSHPKMKDFLCRHGAGAFDLVLLGFAANDFAMGLGAHFGCPIIISFMVQPVSSINRLVGNPSESAYVPSLFSELKAPLTFWGRVLSFLAAFYEEWIVLPIVEINMLKIYNYNFPSDRYPPLDEVRKNVSLIFTNHHFSQGPIRPNVPNLIEIGGIQIKEKPDPLPTDIAKVLDESKEGVIYFSLGSNIKGSHLNEEKIKIMFNVISKLPYKVLWKWSPTELPGESKNIIFRDWLPQDDILAHPNVKLFITHGGMGSVVESQYHGVPMVGIPLFGDQPSNMVNVERSGYGLAVDYLTLSEESLNNAIQDVLNNPKYKEAVQTFSRLYRDRPMTPRETVVYWVNYVLRHKGAKHMQSPAVHMNRWQLLSLDVIGFLLAIVLTISVVIVKVCKLICCRGRKNKLPKVEKAKQN
ncbi:PREDICTED: UDP-glucuronosyltransferase 2B7-like isoform X2 [Bactrocera latifrons]|uniref:UDP-glucuronosyltransferase 2B7 n=1 Tax=Bactrocera latifrons TaxID=174628 RepID=A0A0K8VPH6_BACLA|nr:PREDICTED: UDP-glucuronosyltransferase 2B7-like isoform X2 [Bactrocera latifrons]